VGVFFVGGGGCRLVAAHAGLRLARGGQDLFEGDGLGGDVLEELEVVLVCYGVGYGTEASARRYGTRTAS